jgi:hypothetical protein
LPRPMKPMSMIFSLDYFFPSPLWGGVGVGVVR